MIIQILYNSVLTALILSLVAIGFNIIFNSTKVFHIAHGAIYVCAIYGLSHLYKHFEQLLPNGYAIFVSILLTILLIISIIFLIEYFVYRPLYLKSSNQIISLISSLGVYIIIINTITFLFGNESVSLNNKSMMVYSNLWFKMTLTELLLIITTLITLLCVFLFSKTKYYMNIRAIGYNYSVAAKFGVNVEKTRLVALTIGSILVSIAAISMGYEIAIDPNAGMSITLTAAVAVIIGGSGSLKGTVVASFVIALLENFSILFFSSQWKYTFTYILLILVLLFYNKGLISFNQRIETR